MLISPPFLPPRGNLTEEQWLAAAMSGGMPGAGAYPVSANLDWHGGVHLTAPMNGHTAEPVRAIGDGTVVFRREPTATNDPKHPLNYGGGYTSDGVVVIRHDTEIGADAQGRPTAVRFYSVYHHLYSVRPAVIVNRPIWRKDVIGQAGHIYGVPNQIHFEIRCDEDNLRRLIGRVSGDLSLERDGRTDVLYGEMYFHLPANTPIYGQRPLPNSAEARVAAPPKTPAPALPIALQPVARTEQAMVVGVRYAGGVGEAGHRGDAFVTSYRLDGSTYGAALVEFEAEYKLYENCTAISKSYPAGSQPAPSAVMELLRFGRVIGPDPLVPANVPHWREVSYAGGRGWVNLNAAGVRKYSDADFPQWRGWTLIADDANGDARCDSPTLMSWLDQDGDSKVDSIEGVVTLTQRDVVARMWKTFCKIPCEWNVETLESRWSWIKIKHDRNETPLSADDYEKFGQHAQALCFGLQDLFESSWVINPISFIRHFRGQQWMEEKILSRAYPSATSNHVTIYRQCLNKTLRKYGLQNADRASNFLGQAAIESSQFRWMSELYNGASQDYFRRYEKARNFVGWLGNVQWNDGERYRGRGFKQMTGRSNYANYWVYRGWLQHNSFSSNWWINPGWWGISANIVLPSQYNVLPTQDAAHISSLLVAMRPPNIDNPDRIESDAYACIDTAGWFWAKNKLLVQADNNNAAQLTRMIRGDGSSVGVTVPWPPEAHYLERVAATNKINALLGDSL